jgi:hypothetical protein
MLVLGALVGLPFSKKLASQSQTHDIGPVSCRLILHSLLESPDTESFLSEVGVMGNYMKWPAEQKRLEVAKFCEDFPERWFQSLVGLR